MKTIIVDDEPLMITKFVRLSEKIPDINLVGRFESAGDALEYVRKNPIELAFLDVSMPIKNGIELAKELRALRSDTLIVFISAYDEYLRQFNEIGGDYYIIKPYNRETLEMAMDRIRLIAHRQHKDLYIQTFGRFLVLKNGIPVHLTGKAKEILAYVVTRRGKEVSNAEIYGALWENREYSNASMGVYYNALRRLKETLARNKMSDLLVSTARGQMVNTNLFDCDYYAWKDKNLASRDRFEGEFLSEYSWGEYLLAEIFNEEYS